MSSRSRSRRVGTRVKGSRPSGVRSALIGRPGIADERSSGLKDMPGIPRLTSPGTPVGRRGAKIGGVPDEVPQVGYCVVADGHVLGHKPLYGPLLNIYT